MVSSSSDEVIDLTGDDDDDYRYEVEDSKEGLESLKKAMEEEMRVKELLTSQSAPSRTLKQTTLLPILNQQNTSASNSNIGSAATTSASGSFKNNRLNANGVEQVPQPIALTFNSRASTPPPPLPPSSPPPSSSH
ncbi:hypothetical protein HELRODRAFT_115096, partial [Helobdella robusta]|uniref:Uncharacterized protein n=1 Tax=Helobdella robusta TaxID=6412 RepID=T1EG63_HELRO